MASTNVICHVFKKFHTYINQFIHRSDPETSQISQGNHSPKRLSLISIQLKRFQALANPWLTRFQFKELFLCKFDKRLNQEKHTFQGSDDSTEKSSINLVQDLSNMSVGLFHCGHVGLPKPGKETSPTGKRKKKKTSLVAISKTNFQTAEEAPAPLTCRNHT